jgi:hypothetical protein
MLLTPTPQTDQAEHGFIAANGEDMWGIACVDSSFARTLERERDRFGKECAALEIERDHYKSLCEELRKSLSKAEMVFRGDSYEKAIQKL